MSEVSEFRPKKCTTCIPVLSNILFLICICVFSCRGADKAGGSSATSAAGSIATFNVDHKSSKELRQYLANIVDQCEQSSAGELLPTVIVLDNLHHVSSLAEVFDGFLSIKHVQW